MWIKSPMTAGGKPKFQIIFAQFAICACTCTNTALNCEVA
jgi:hypothetical protein